MANIFEKIAEATIGAVGDLVSLPLTIFSENRSKNFSREMSDRSFVQAQALAAQQQEFNVENFNMANEYNNPSAMMQRLRGAGINPAVALSNGLASVSSGNSNGISPSGMPSAPSPLSGSFGKQVGKGLDSELTRNFAAADKDRADAKLADEQREGQRVANAKSNLDMQYYADRIKAEYEELANRAKESGETATAAEYEAKIKEIEKEIAETTKDSRIQQIYDEGNEQGNKATLAAEEVYTEREKQDLIKEQRASEQQNRRESESRVELNRKLGLKADADTSLTNRMEKVQRTIQNSNVLDYKQKKLAYRIALLSQTGNESMARAMNDANNMPYVQWASRWKAYISATPLLGNILDAIGGTAQTYAAFKIANSAVNSSTSEEVQYNARGEQVGRTTRTNVQKKSSKTPRARLKRLIK